MGDSSPGFVAVIAAEAAAEIIEEQNKRFALVVSDDSGVAMD